MFVFVAGLGACGSSPPPASIASHRGPEPVDLCPSEPEDIDGFQDGDGCVDRDNDGDRIADLDDMCPNDGEVYNGHEDTDGCPDRGCVLLERYPTCINEPVYFARGTTVPLEENEPIVDLVARAMAEVTDIEVVTIRGERSRNEPVALASQRAEAFKNLLVTRGISADRLALEDGGVVAAANAPDGQQRVSLDITRQRVSYRDLDEIVCTPMGRVFVRLSETEKAARCRAVVP